MNIRSGEFGVRQRVIGAVTCYAALIALAAFGLVAAIAVIGAGLGVVVADWQRPTRSASSAPASPSWPVATTALLVVPVASNVLIIGLVAAGGSPLDALPLEASAGVATLAAFGAGVAAVRGDAAPESHGWWALAGGGVAVILFGVLVALFSS